jgi:hypothetical protein
MDLEITWKGGRSVRLEWPGARLTLGGSPADTHVLPGAPAALVELTCSGPHRLLRTAVPHSMGALRFPAHVWRLWPPGERLIVGEHLQLGLLAGPHDAAGTAAQQTSVLARHLLGDEEHVAGLESASLRVLSGRDVGRRLLLGGGCPVVLGRGRGCALPLVDETISRTHLGFEVREDTWWVEDLGSPNGLYVDGRRWRRCALRSGAILELGRVWLRFEVPGHAPTPPPAPVPPQEQPGLPEENASLPVEDPALRPAADRWLRALVGLGGALALIGAAWL